MHYGAMTLQDYDQVMALCAGESASRIKTPGWPALLYPKARKCTTTSFSGRYAV